MVSFLAMVKSLDFNRINLLALVAPLENSPHHTSNSVSKGTVYCIADLVGGCQLAINQFLPQLALLCERPLLAEAAVHG
jgi:hypothetical protein